MRAVLGLFAHRYRVEARFSKIFDECWKLCMVFLMCVPPRTTRYPTIVRAVGLSTSRTYEFYWPARHIRERNCKSGRVSACRWKTHSRQSMGLPIESTGKAICPLAMKLG